MKNNKGEYPKFMINMALACLTGDTSFMDYEGEVIDAVEEVFECDRSDAQGITMCRTDFIEKCFEAGSLRTEKITPRQCAEMMLKGDGDPLL